MKLMPRHRDMNFHSTLMSILCLISPVSLAMNVHFFATGGPDFSTLKNNERVAINSVVTNAYRPQEHTVWKPLAGFGIGYDLPPTFSFYQLSFNIAGYFIDLGSIHGIEYPFINSGVFDTLNYQFNVKSQTIMFEPCLLYSRTEWQPFALIGIGVAWNKLSKFQETPTNPALSAAAVSPGFSPQTTQQFAYEFGIGLQRQLWKDNLHQRQLMGAIGYRYFGLGQGSLGAMPMQTSNQRLGSDPLFTQALLLSLTLNLGT